MALQYIFTYLEIYGNHEITPIHVHSCVCITAAYTSWYEVMISFVNPEQTPSSDYDAVEYMHQSCL